MKRLIVAFMFVLAAGSSFAASDFRKLARNVNRSTVLVNHEKAGDPDNRFVCTGFSVNYAQGLFITAGHCVDDKFQTYIGEFKVDVVKKNDAFALLKAHNTTVPPLELGKAAEQGQEVVAVGLAGGKDAVLATNIVQVVEGDFLVSVPFIHGMSGGPVVDSKGRVVGMVQATTPSNGIACGIEEIRAFIKSEP